MVLVENMVELEVAAALAEFAVAKEEVLVKAVRKVEAEEVREHARVPCTNTMTIVQLLK